MKHLTPARLHSNDVTIYSCLIGRYFTGKKLDAKLKSDYNYKGVMQFVEKYLDDGVGTLAVILILSKMGVYLSSKPNPYYERMIKAYVDQFDNLWYQIKVKLEKIEPFIASMYEGMCVNGLMVCRRMQASYAVLRFFLETMKRCSV